MTEQFGIPVWGSYLIFAVATIVVGLLLGLVSEAKSQAKLCTWAMNGNARRKTWYASVMAGPSLLLWLDVPSEANIQWGTHGKAPRTLYTRCEWQITYDWKFGDGSTNSKFWDPDICLGFLWGGGAFFTITGCLSFTGVISILQQDIDEPDVPVDEPDVPVHEPDVPVHEPDVPVHEPDVPVDEPDLPVDEPKTETTATSTGSSGDTSTTTARRRMPKTDWDNFHSVLCSWFLETESLNVLLSKNLH